ncbi:MAG: hypothetical protein RLY47_349 [Candidatus Parcubacteria bacterium]|jgi:hypothetical protein
MSTAAPQHVANPLVFWMTLRIGGVDPVDHITRLEAKGVRLDRTTREVLCSRQYVPGPKRFVTFGRCQVKDFGFTERPTTTELLKMFERWRAICPPETAPHGQEALVGDDREDCASVVMPTIPDRHDAPQMLTIRKTAAGVCRMSARYAHPSHRWSLDYEVIGVLAE